MKKSDKIACYSSHLPVLKLLFKKFKIRNILEFGIGNYSTMFFIDMGFDKLFSIETNRKWAEKFIKNKLDNHFIILFERRDPFKINILEKFDLCFTDGSPAGARIDFVNNNVHKSNISVFHDSESKWLKRKEIIIPDGYTRFDHDNPGFIPSTSIIIKNSFIDNEIRNFFNKAMAVKS